MKKIKLDQDKLLGFRILQQTPKIGRKRNDNIAATTISGKIGAKPGVKPSSRLGAKLGIKPGS